MSFLTVDASRLPLLAPSPGGMAAARTIADIAVSARSAPRSRSSATISVLSMLADACASSAQSFFGSREDLRASVRRFSVECLSDDDASAQVLDRIAIDRR